MKTDSFSITRLFRFMGAASAIFAAFHSSCWASASGDLEKAKANGRVAFVLVSEPGAIGVGEAESVIREAVKRQGKAVLIKLDRTAPENSGLVSRFRLSGPQIPLIMVFAPNGIAAGGALTDGMTVDGLLGMVPTKSEVELIEALQSGKGVLVMASRSGLAGEDEVLKACEKARSMSSGKLAVVRVDMGDKAEQSLLRKLKISEGTDKPVTVAINSSGQVTGSFSGPADPAELVVASAKKAGGCCSGGKKRGAVCKTR